MLSEDHRTKLLHIVKKATKKGESKENIQRIVSLYKGKYDVESQEQAPQGEVASPQQQALADSLRAERGAPQGPQGKGFWGSIFPSTDIYEQGDPQGLTQEQVAADKQKAIEMSPWGALARPEAGAAPLVPVAEDVFSLLPRGVEAGKRMFTDESSVEALQDPREGIFRGSREEGAQFWAEKAQKTENPVMKKMFEGFGIANAMGWGAAEDPSTFVNPPKLAKALIPRRISRRPGFRQMGVPAEALTTPEGIPLTPAQAKELPTDPLEIRAQQNPYTQGIPAKIREKQIEKFTETADKISKDVGGRPIDELQSGSSVRGNLIREKFKDFKNVNDKLFGEGEKFIQRSVGQKPVNFREIDILSSKKDFIGIDGMPMRKVINTITKTNAMDKIEAALSRVGHNLGDDVKNIGQISSDGINQALKAYDDIAEAGTISELLSARRNIMDEVFQKEKKDLFKGDKDLAFMRGLNKEINDSIEETIRNVSPGVQGENISNAFRAMNEQYSSNLDLVKVPANKMGIGREGMPEKDVMGKIKLIGAKHLDNMKTAAKSKPEVKALYTELQTGAYEDLIQSSLNKHGQISLEKLMTKWGGLDKEFKKAIFPNQIIGELDKLVATAKKVTSGDLTKLNPSGTSKGLQYSGTGSIASDLLKRATGILSYLPTRHYYKTGKRVHESVFNSIVGPDGKFYLTDKRLQSMARAKSLTSFLKDERSKRSEKPEKRKNETRTMLKGLDFKFPDEE